MPKFSRRFAIKLAGGLFAFIPVVKYLADTTSAHADGYQIPGCSSTMLGTTYCDDPNKTGTRTLWAVYIGLGCFERYGTYSVSRLVDTGVAC